MMVAIAARRTPAHRVRAGLLFLRAAVRDPGRTGSVTPSGRRLAEALAAPVSERGDRPISVLEVGAGTGPVTSVLLTLMPPGGRLDVVEANSAFLPGLRRLVAGHTAEVTVHGCRIEDLDTDRRYDVVVSSLPFTNMAASDVEGLLRQYRRLTNPGGTITWFAYRGSRRARALTASAEELRRHTNVEAVLAHQGGSHRDVWANVPPARVTRIHVA